MIHEVTPLISIPTALGDIEAWADREKPIVVRMGPAIVPLSIAQAQEVMRALADAVRALPVKSRAAETMRQLRAAGSQG